MRKQFGKQTWMLPMPVLIIGTYDEKGNADAMNAAWGGIHDTNQIGICLSAEHRTTKNIFVKKEFTVSMADAPHTVEADYVGLVSADQDPEKMKKSGLTPVKCETIDAPYFEEFPMTLECRMVSYDDASGYLVADIVNVTADERILGEDGKIDTAKLNPILVDTVNAAYYRFGEKAGNAFRDGLKLKG